MTKRERKCIVCKQKIKADKNENDECLNCGWFNSALSEEMENDVVFPNLVSLNRAKECFKKNKIIKPKHPRIKYDISKALKKIPKEG